MILVHHNFASHCFPQNGKNSSSRGREDESLADRCQQKSPRHTSDFFRPSKVGNICILGPPYLCSTRQWLDEGWIVGGYSPDIVLICMAFIYRICMQYPHFTNAYDLSTRHLSIPVLYPPVTCACPPYIYDRHLYLQFIQRMSAVIYNTRSACFIHVIFQRHVTQLTLETNAA